jgi:hypothetical protein
VLHRLAKKAAPTFSSLSRWPGKRWIRLMGHYRFDLILNWIFWNRISKYSVSLHWSQYFFLFYLSC